MLVFRDASSPPPSCQALCLASTTFFVPAAQAVDPRHKAWDDEFEMVCLHVTPQKSCRTVVAQALG